MKRSSVLLFHVKTRFSALGSITKLSKNGKFDRCKVRLEVQGQHVRKKGVDGIGDYEDSFSPVPHTSGFHTILAIATMWNMMDRPHRHKPSIRAR